MIFSTEYFNTLEPKHGCGYGYKGLPLAPQRAPYLGRSLSLIHNLYNKWMNSNEGFSIEPFELKVTPNVAEQALECLFVKIQDEAAWMAQGEDKAIAMVSRYHKDRHIGFFLVKHHTVHFTNVENGSTIHDYAVFARVMTNCLWEVVKAFQGCSFGEIGSCGHSGSNSYDPANNNVERAEEVFQDLCKIASVLGIEPSKEYRFQVRYGYNPAPRREPFKLKNRRYDAIAKMIKSAQQEKAENQESSPSPDQDTE
jgi:hypothetical protein